MRKKNFLINWGTFENYQMQGVRSPQVPGSYFALVTLVLRLVSFIVLVCIVLLMNQCGAANVDIAEVDNAVSFDAPIVADASFTMVSGDSWDNTAVRQVLFIFAYGGFATDTQIQLWADMDPGAAIVEMLTLDTVNPYLSPAEAYDQLDQYDGTLTGLSTLWSANSDDSQMLATDRDYYDKYTWAAPARTWFAAATKRGLNPVRQKIGMLESNYHLAVNQDVGVSNKQIFTYYDAIMNDLAADLTYQAVLANAALAAAVATQYDHKDNIFIDARFEGNEDFAREFHQLFFGILGDYDSEYHELTTIKNTAKALTDMSVAWVTESDKSFYDDTVTFGTEYHYPSDLQILNQTISGATAAEKIEALAQIAIDHEESLDNLPVLLVRFLADDDLDDNEVAAVRAIWQGLGTKDLMTFLRKYAISTAFHSATRVKYATSIDRHVTIANLMTLSNEEGYLGYYDPYYYVYSDGAEVFRPMHNVFGGQTGLDAADSGSIFKDAYNRSINNTWFFSRYHDDDDDWIKDWASVLPADASGDYRVQEVAEWLWQRFVADGLENFGTLERVQVYALLGSGRDFGLFADAAAPEAVYLADDIEGDSVLSSLYSDMAIAKMNLNSDDETKRGTANHRVGLAIAFIEATPYVFAR